MSALGHVRQSPRSEVGPEAIEVLRPLLDQALRGEHAPIPGQPGYTMTGGVHGRCCVVTLWRVIPDTTGERMPVLHVGIGAHSRCAAHVWRALHDMAGERLPVRTDRERPHVTPWVADLLDMGSTLDSAE